MMVHVPVSWENNARNRSSRLFAKPVSTESNPLPFRVAKIPWPWLRQLLGLDSVCRELSNICRLKKADTTYVGLPNNPGSDETGRSDYFYGDTLWYQTSEAWPATNQTILNRTEESLQMLTIDVRYGSNSRGDESVVLCQIARAQSVENSTQPGENSTQSSDNSTSSGDKSGAMGFGGHSKVALWSALILSVLFAL